MAQRTDFPAIDVPGEGELYARFVTSLGAFVARLEERRAPRTVANFVGLATGSIDWVDPASKATMTGTPLFKNVCFHRVVPKFMVQCGDPFARSPEHANRWGTGDPGYTFDDEIVPGLVHDKPGVLSMANEGANTNGSQFFITHRALKHLDGVHTVFGRVVLGQAVVDAIGNVPRDRRDRPDDDVVLERVDIFRATTTPTR